LPNGKATDAKIGKGGNGFVFTIYHERKQYAVKKVTRLIFYMKAKKVFIDRVQTK